MTLASFCAVPRVCVKKATKLRLTALLQIHIGICSYLITVILLRSTKREELVGYRPFCLAEAMGMSGAYFKYAENFSTPVPPLHRRRLEWLEMPPCPR